MGHAEPLATIAVDGERLQLVNFGQWTPVDRRPSQRAEYLCAKLNMEQSRDTASIPKQPDPVRALVDDAIARVGGAIEFTEQVTEDDEDLPDGYQPIY